MNRLLNPNGSSRYSDCRMAWNAGQKKNTSVIAICGATSR
jgi:hypothetical protein